MNAAVQYVYKRRTVAPELYESGILPGESEDPPGVYLPTKAGRLAPRQTPDVFLHISICYQLRLPQRYSSKINTLIKLIEDTFTTLDMKGLVRILVRVSRLTQ